MGVTHFVQPKNRKEVGFTKIKGKLLNYGKVRFDKEGWADPSKYLPLRGDLVVLQTRSGKLIPGWWAGAYWFGVRVTEKDHIIKWKLSEEEND